MSKQKIKNIFRQVSPGRIIENYRNSKEYKRWVQAGKPVPPPDSFKQSTVRQYAKQYGIRVFIETGTYLGDMVHSVKDLFHEIYSIELSAELYERAKKKFFKYKHISILEGDSSKVLPQILNHVVEPCIFWLDGHWSGGITAKGEKETPIVAELNHVLGHSIKDHVILIDDARCFTGKNGYPTLAELRELISDRYPNNIFEVRDDIIRTHKKT
jgi:hypothetical protein